MKVLPRIVAGALALSVTSPLLAAQNYPDALYKSTYFFGAQRCGDNDSWIHQECHWSDATLSAGGQTVDLSGGWHDCGDHVKFGQTNSFAAGFLLHGYLNFKAAHKDNYSPANSSGSSNGIPDVLDEVKYFTDYLLKTLVGNRLYFQVSSADVDHNSVAEPNYQSSQPSGSTERQAFWVEDGGASNIAGANAAVLAMMSMAYREFDSGYADQCLDMAKKMYAFGDNSHESQSSLNSSWVADETYEAGSWEDDMAWGAIELYKATGDDTYKNAVPSLLSATDLFPSYFAPDYTNCAALAAYSYDKYTGTTTYKSKLKTEIDFYRDAQYSSSIGMTIFDTWGSTKYAAAASYVSLLYYNLDNSYTAAMDFAKSNIDFILGDHGNVPNDAPSGFSFLVGYGSNYPDGQVHHSAAAGLDIDDYEFSQWHDDYYDNANTLTGAVVGGPTSKTGGYHNNRDEATWGASAEVKSNEVCIYYNAPFVAAVGAIEILSNSSSENYAPTDIILSNSQISSGQPSGSVVGGLSAVDNNSGDTHTFSLVSGDKLKVEGDKLVTTESLSAGTYKATVKVDDGNGGTFQKELTVTVVEAATVANNIIYDLGWYAYTNGFGSKVNGAAEDTALLVDGVVKAEFDIIAEDEANEIWPGGSIEIDSLHINSNGEFSYEDGVVTNMSNIDYIIIEYKSNQAFNFVLPLPGTNDDDYKVALPSTAGALKVDTIYLNSTVFKQEGYGTAVSFDKSKMYQFGIATAFNNTQGYFEIQTVELEGVKVTPIAQTFANKKLASPAITSLTSQKLELAVPVSGNYRIELMGLNGQKLWSSEANIQSGVSHAISLKNASLSTGMILVRISGNGFNSVAKAILK